MNMYICSRACAGTTSSIASTHLAIGSAHPRVSTKRTASLQRLPCRPPPRYPLHHLHPGTLIEPRIKLKCHSQPARLTQCTGNVVEEYARTMTVHRPRPPVCLFHQYLDLPIHQRCSLRTEVRRLGHLPAQEGATSAGRPGHLAQLLGESKLRDHGACDAGHLRYKHKQEEAQRKHKESTEKAQRKEQGF